MGIEQDWVSEDKKILPYVHLFPIVIFVEVLGGKENSGECFSLQSGRGGGRRDGEEKEGCRLLSGRPEMGARFRRFSPEP